VITPSLNGTLEAVQAIPMQQKQKDGDGVWHYQLELAEKLDRAKQTRLRVLPRHPALRHKHELGLIHWRDLE
jgi:hypothetical protein